MKTIGIFDHPMVPALVITAWAVGVIMGMMLIEFVRLKW